VIIRRKHWGLQTGYNVVLDLRYGFSLCFGHKPKGYRWIVAAHWDWPRLVWADRYWQTSRPMPIARAKPLLFSFPVGGFWPHRFEVGNG
jgi:hypothetical protein